MSNDNLFIGATDIEGLLGQMVGSGSMCWENPEGAGEFDATMASKVVSHGLARLSELIGNLQ